MSDFTLKIYRSLLEALLNKGYSFVRFDEYVKSETSDEKSEKQETRGTQRPFDSAQGDKANSVERKANSADHRATSEETLRQAQGDNTLSAKHNALCVLSI